MSVDQRDIEIWRSGLLSAIKDISNIETLENIWCGNNVNYFSSFQESVAHIFSDYDIEAFISLTKVLRGLNDDQMAKLIEFKESFSHYINLPDIRIDVVGSSFAIRDGRWRLVMDRAAIFIDSIS